MQKHLLNIVNSSSKIEKIILSVQKEIYIKIEIKKEYLLRFLYNSIIRFNHLTKTYSNVENGHYFTRLILLRPLLLDSMLFMLLQYLGEKEDWNRFKEILNDSIAEGVKGMYYNIKKIYEMENKTTIEKNQALQDFHIKYSIFFEDNSTIHNIEFKKRNFKIKPDYIVKELKSTALNDKVRTMDNLYQIISKFEHNTIISLELHKVNNFPSKVIPDIEKYIFDGYINLLCIMAKSYSDVELNITNEIINEIEEFFILKKNYYNLA